MILVTGAAGFIGSNIVASLNKKGYKRKSGKQLSESNL